MKRILIVEDEPSIAMVLEDDLRREGYHTEITADGDAAAPLRRGADAGDVNVGPSQRFVQVGDVG